jgi:hypothetical protein
VYNYPDSQACSYKRSGILFRLDGELDGIGCGESVRLFVNLCLLMDNNFCLLLDNNLCLSLDNNFCFLLNNNLFLLLDNNFCLLLDNTLFVFGGTMSCVGQNSQP